MSKGLKYSIVLHIIFVITSLIYVTKDSKISSTERVITVDLVKIKPSSTTNLKNSPIARKSKKKKPKNITTPSRISKKIKPQKALHKKTISKKSRSNNVVQQQEKISDQIKIDKEVGKLLDNLEKNITSMDQSQDNNKSKKANLVTSDKPYDKNLPLSIAEQDNIKMQIERKFFNPIVSDFNSGEIIIKIKLDMAKTGEIEKVIVLNSSSYTRKHSDAFIALKDSLIRAAHMASPIQGLDDTRYEGKNGWKEIILIFDAYYLTNT
ncbi:MAG: hypothetical protein HRU36_01555 [Rickettsiales bacterium]|nr:hypothetical protein [Rickettsiales bacterium]